MLHKLPAPVLRHPKLRSLAENPLLALIARMLIPVILAIAGFLALRVEQDHDGITTVQSQLAAIQDGLKAATANRYTSIDAERDRIVAADALGYVRDAAAKVEANHEARIERLEGRR